MSQLPFIDLGAQRRRLGDRVDEAILKVVNHGAYVMGPEVTELEEKLASSKEDARRLLESVVAAMAT